MRAHAAAASVRSSASTAHSIPYDMGMAAVGFKLECVMGAGPDKGAK